MNALLAILNVFIDPGETVRMEVTTTILSVPDGGMMENSALVIVPMETGSGDTPVDTTVASTSAVVATVNYLLT